MASGFPENASGRFLERTLGIPRRCPGANRFNMTQDILSDLEHRLGPLHAKQRLGIETDHEAQAFGQGLNFFHVENWYSIHSVIRNMLRLMGLYGRGLRNADRVEVRHNDLKFGQLPPPFDGFAILHISDMHVEMSEGAMNRLIELVRDMHYDICVLTGDYRGKTFGPFDATLAGVARVRSHLHGPVFGVLGNHDTIRMVPGLELMGIRVLLNESETISRGDERIHLAGIDDAHFYRVDNIEKAAARIPRGEFAILLSHTPEVYRQAALAGFRLLLSGHTHGGQICMPRSIPITLDSLLPRRFGLGAWKYHDMAGYTSVGAGSCIGPVRINSRPEITLASPAQRERRLRRTGAPRQYGRSRICALYSSWERTTSPPKNTPTQMAMSKTDNDSAPRQTRAGKSDSGIWSSPVARLLGRRFKRRFTKLERRSPAIAAPPIATPMFQPSPSSGADAAVRTSESTIPRMVLDLPNSGLPSTSSTPPSSGYANRCPKSLAAITGVPFAMANRRVSCKITIG